MTIDHLSGCGTWSCHACSAGMNEALQTSNLQDCSVEHLHALSQQRLAIEGVNIEIDGGRFAAKAVAGQPLTIEADIFSDGHDLLSAAVRYRMRGGDWKEAPFRFVENDRWRVDVTFERPGDGEVEIIAWRDVFGTWQKDVGRKIAAGQDVAVEIAEARLLVEAASQGGGQTKELHAALVHAEGLELLEILRSPRARMAMAAGGPRTDLTPYARRLAVQVDRSLAAFGAWYELMPRSQAEVPGQHGTFNDVIARLPYVRDLGFDILYLTPIHPIGRTNRKGRNNSLAALPGDPGSPYAIGSEDGGHDAVHPQLGTLDDFRKLVEEAQAVGLEIALDFAIQCSPDHPWIAEHPEWFDWRPDGTIKFAENPPKKYEDIVNVHFYGSSNPSLWLALRDVVLFWVAQGVRIFRVDNPHTKPFPFWEWLIAEVRQVDPDVIFLSEAFTRPKVMKRLAKLGFAQSYSYFTWRNTKVELQDYLEELNDEDTRLVMRPNFFANTPDINPRFLQTAGRPGFRARLVLAATLTGNYGIYSGFELCEAAAVAGKEEYLDSEKYEIRHWDFDRPGHIKDDIRLINRLRRDHPALGPLGQLSFLNFWNDEVIYYARQEPDSASYLLFHVLLDPHNAQEGDFEVPLWEFGQPDDGSVMVEDLLHGNSFTWHGKTHRLRLDPHTRPYAIWRLHMEGRS
jgi:starch synthase (maltosyl-transferring)